MIVSTARDAPDEEPARRLAELFERHADAIYAYATHRLSAADAHDLVSEVFLTAWRRLHSVRVGEERAWLFGVARRLILARYRHTAHWVALQTKVSVTQQSALDDIAEDVIQRQLVRAALARLTEADRELLVTAYWYDLRPSEAAQVLGCSRATFAVRLHRARRRFLAVLSKQSSASVPQAGRVTTANVRSPL